MGGIRDLIRFIRVETLDDSNRRPPDEGIYTASRQPRVILPPDNLAEDEFYNIERTWTKESFNAEKNCLHQL